MKLSTRVFYRTLYRPVMRVAHYFNWHYAPPCYPEGDTHLWCQWCGFRQTIKRAGDKDRKSGIASARASAKGEGDTP